MSKKYQLEVELQEEKQRLVLIYNARAEEWEDLTPERVPVSNDCAELYARNLCESGIPARVCDLRYQELYTYYPGNIDQLRPEV